MFMSLNAQADSDTLKIVIQENNVFLEAILPPLLTQANLKADIVSRPSERSLIELNAGKIHANGLRLKVLDDLYPNIIKMEEPVENIDFIAITNNNKIKVTRWDDLKNYKVGYPNGWKIFDLNVPKDTSVIKVNTQRQLFQMLNIQRIDVALLSTPIARTLLKEIDVPNIRFLEPALHKTPSYLYFHTSKKEEAERMSQALKTLKQNGIYQKTYKTVYDHQ